MEKVSDLEVQRLWGYSPGASLGTGAATVSGRLRGLLWMGAIALGLHYNDMLWSSLKLLALVAIAMAFLLIANQSRMLYAPQPGTWPWDAPGRGGRLRLLTPPSPPIAPARSASPARHCCQPSGLPQPARDGHHTV